MVCYVGCTQPLLQDNVSLLCNMGEMQFLNGDYLCAMSTLQRVCIILWNEKQLVSLFVQWSFYKCFLWSRHLFSGTGSGPLPCGQNGPLGFPLQEGEEKKGIGNVSYKCLWYLCSNPSWWVCGESPIAQPKCFENVMVYTIECRVSLQAPPPSSSCCY